MSDGKNPTAQGIAEAAYRELERQRAAEIAALSVEMAKGMDVDPPPLRRLRLATTKDGMPAVDLSKADNGCTRCGGLGRLPDMVVVDEDTGQEASVPVICMCVHRNGGVAQDMLDRMLAEAAKKH